MGIEANTRCVLEQEVGPFFDRWTRIAITVKQADGLPKIKKYDRRYKPPRVHEAVETEALSQKLIIELLETKLAALLPEPLERVHERQQRQRRALKRTILQA